jgi:hypothetical protein
MQADLVVKKKMLTSELACRIGCLISFQLVSSMCGRHGGGCVD